MIKTYLISDTQVEMQFPECLDCIGNNTVGRGGYRDKVEAITNLTFDEVQDALKKTFKKAPSFFTLTKEIEPIDFEDIKRQKLPYELDYSGLSEVDYYASINKVQVSINEVSLKKSKKKRTTKNRP